MNRPEFAFLAATLCVSPQASAIASSASVQSGAPAGDSVSKPERIEDVNAAVVAARTATKDKRYGEAETLMLKVTSSRPELIIPWLELGLAQLGLKKYPEAENSFKIALGVTSGSESRVDLPVDWLPLLRPIRCRAYSHANASRRSIKAAQVLFETKTGSMRSADYPHAKLGLFAHLGSSDPLN